MEKKKSDHKHLKQEDTDSCNKLHNSRYNPK